jgi:hypothetical protein
MALKLPKKHNLWAAGLPAADTLTGAELLAVVQGGVSRQTTTQTPATQAEAEAGTGTAVRSWTPARVWQAIVAKLTAGVALRITGYDRKQLALPIAANAVTIPLDGVDRYVVCTSAVNLITFVAAANGYIGSTRVAFIYDATTGPVAISTPTTSATPNRVSQNCITSLGLKYILRADTLPGPDGLIGISMTPWGVP